MKAMDRVSRGEGFRGAVNYIFGNFKASFLCASHVLAVKDAGRAISKLGTLARRLRPDITRPVWHQALRLPRGEVISHEKFSLIAHDYMRRMGWNPDINQYVAIVSDDPEGQHIHIVASRVGIDGSIFYGRNENLISTRVCKELEQDHGLKVTRNLEYVVDGRGIPRARFEAPKDKKLTKHEMRLAERRARESEVKPLPRKTLQRVLKSALAAGEVGGMAAFLSAAEAGGIRVLANVASTGRVNGLSFESCGVPFKASQVGDRYAWAALTTSVGYSKERDQALLEARSLRHVSRSQLPPLGQPAPSVRLPTPSAAVKPIVINTHAPKEATYVQRYHPSYRARLPAATSGGGRSLAGGPSLHQLRALPRSSMDAAVRLPRPDAASQGVVPGDSLVQLGVSRRAGRRLRPDSRGARPAAPAAGVVRRDPSMLEAVRAAQDMQHWMSGTLTVRVVVLMTSALEGYTVKPGRYGTLYIRKSDDTYAMVDTGSRIKVAVDDGETVRAALAAASGKWSSLTLGGSDSFKSLAVREAVRLGVADRIQNPELADMVRRALGRQSKREDAPPAVKQALGGPSRGTDPATPIVTNRPQARRLKL